ncbi:4Fe-4S dicluster domain-containing protein [Candidatus Hecatella orcuttiae]|uniref:4Fe-4S dicluster domain-containing protein n=1 Tax=Candidatus Hecatella orcuttiae TaxID=1935119 RepID=UPI002867B49C|nr:4Fe-4S dicluster domain-containing protein [Candidatus Hecatella orcuttiae]
MEKRLRQGFITSEDLKNLPDKERLKKGWVAVIECPQNIPCDACIYACKTQALEMKTVADLPVINYDKCIGCFQCMHACPGVAIFMVRLTDDGKGMVSLPYEFTDLPKAGETVDLLNRLGEKLGPARVIRTFSMGKDAAKSSYVTVETAPELIWDARFIRRR